MRLSMRPLATLSNSVSLFCDGSCARSLELPYADASVACSLLPSGKGADCTERSGLLFAVGEEAGGVSGMGQGTGDRHWGKGVEDTPPLVLLLPHLQPRPPKLLMVPLFASLATLAHACPHMATELSSRAYLRSESSWTGGKSLGSTLTCWLRKAVGTEGNLGTSRAVQGHELSRGNKKVQAPAKAIQRQQAPVKALQRQHTGTSSEKAKDKQHHALFKCGTSSCVDAMRGLHSTPPPHLSTAVYDPSSVTLSSCLNPRRSSP